DRVASEFRVHRLGCSKHFAARICSRLEKGTRRKCDEAYSYWLTDFALTSCSFLAAMLLGAALPEHHLSKDSRETAKLGVGLMATVTALVLGLVIASVKSSFDDLSTAVKHTAAEILTLDRTLARYGPETQEIGEQLKSVVRQRLEMTWPQGPSQPARLDSADLTRQAEQLVDQLHRLPPQNDDQRWLKAKAVDLTESLLSARWILA